MNKNTTKYHRFNEGTPNTINFEWDELAEQPAKPANDESLRHDDELGSGLAFISFGSGSSGNCAYIGTPQNGVLIDAGVDPQNVFDELRRNGIGRDAVKGVVLTHDHQDHVRYVYKIVRDYNKQARVYCTMRLMNGMLRRHNISRRVKDYQVPIWVETPFKLCGMEFTAFETSHDGTDNMGFSIQMGQQTFVVATDMGVITPRAEHYMQNAHYLMIESNYDRTMLDTGRYPEFLKARVRSNTGHLDNSLAAQFVREHYHPGLKWVFLCHLSNDNNTPALALAAMRDAIESRGLTVGDASNAPDQRGRDIQLYALPRYEASPFFIL